MLGSLGHDTTRMQSDKGDPALIAEWLERFTTDVARGRYARAAAALTAALHEHRLSLATATLPDVQRAVQRVAERSRGAPSRNVPQMLSLLAFAYERGHLRFNPLNRIRVMKPTQRVRFTRADFEKLCKVMPARDQIIAHLIYIDGIRPVDLCSRTWSDVTVAVDGTVAIVVPDQISRRTSLPPDLAGQLLGSRGIAHEGAPVFTITGSSSPITVKSVNERIKRAARRAGLKGLIIANTLWHASLDRSTDASPARLP